MMKFFIVICLLLCCGCTNTITPNNNTQLYSYINKEGMNLLTRINTPEGYKRVEADSHSFEEYVRNYPLKEDGSALLLYNGEKKGNQSSHVAIFDLPIENADLQQCADSIMRIYAEYYYQRKEYDKISFHFVDGFKATFSKWVQGYRINVDGKTCSK